MSQSKAIHTKMTNAPQKPCIKRIYHTTHWNMVYFHLLPISTLDWINLWDEFGYLHATISPNHCLTVSINTSAALFCTRRSALHEMGRVLAGVKRWHHMASGRALRGHREISSEPINHLQCICWFGDKDLCWINPAQAKDGRIQLIHTRSY